MKNLFSIIPFFYATIAIGQINFSSAGGASGIILSDFKSGMNFGYSFSSSEATFTYSSQEWRPVWQFTLKDGQVINDTDENSTSIRDGDVEKKTLLRNEFLGNNLRVTLPVTDNTSSILNGGEFNPGLGVTWEFIYSENDFADNEVYEFARLSYAVAQNKFGNIAMNDSINIENKASHTFGFAFGIKWNYFH